MHGQRSGFYQYYPLSENELLNFKYELADIRIQTRRATVDRDLSKYAVLLRRAEGFKIQIDQSQTNIKY